MALLDSPVALKDEEEEVDPVTGLPKVGGGELAMPGARPEPLEQGGTGGAPTGLTATTADGTQTPVSLFPPEQSKTVTTSTGADRPTEGAAKALGEREQVIEEHAQASQTIAEKQGEVDAETAAKLREIEASKARATKMAEEAKIEETNNVRAEAQKRMAVADAKIAKIQQARDEAFQRTKGNIISEAPWWGKLLAGLSVWSATRNSYILGEDPESSPLMRGLDRMLTQDAAQRMAEYERQGTLLKEARDEGVDIEAKRKEKEGEIAADHAQLLKLFDAQAEAEKASAAADPMIVDGVRAVARAAAVQKEAEAQAKLLESQAKLQEPYRKPGTETKKTLVDKPAGNAGGKTTEGERGGAALAHIMTGGLKEALQNPMPQDDAFKWRENIQRESFASKGIGQMIDLAGRVVLGKELSPTEGQTQGLSTQGKKAAVSMGIFNEGVLRMLTGAAAPDSEKETVRANYSIQPGDLRNLELVQWKAENAIRAVEAAYLKGGKAITPEARAELDEIKRFIKEDIPTIAPARRPKEEKPEPKKRGGLLDMVNPTKDTRERADAFRGLLE